MQSHQSDDPRPTDPPFLFVMLLAARKAGDKMLDSLARDWLAELGISVTFANDLPTPTARKGVRRFKWSSELGLQTTKPAPRKTSSRQEERHDR